MAVGMLSKTSFIFMLLMATGLYTLFDWQFVYRDNDFDELYDRHFQ